MTQPGERSQTVDYTNVIFAIFLETEPQVFHAGEFGAGREW